MSLFNKYVFLNLKDYGFEYDFYLNVVIIAIFIGLSVACFIVNKNQSSVALVLRKLLRAEAIGEDNAKTLKSLGLENDSAVKKLLLSSTGYMKGIVTYVGAKKLSYEKFMASVRTKKGSVYRKRGESKENNENPEENFLSPNLSEALFYIPEDKKEAAERAFIKNNGTLTKTVLSCVALLGFMILLVLIMPAILRTVSNISFV